MANVPVPRELSTRAGWGPSHELAWNDLIAVLQRGGHTIPPDADLKKVQEIYLRSLFRGQPALTEVLASDTERANYFNMFFNAFVADRGAVVQLDPNQSGSRMLAMPRFRGDTAEGQPNQPLLPAIGVPQGFRAGQANREQEWGQLVARLRATGRLTQENPTEDDVRRAFLMSRVSPTDEDTIRGIASLNSTDLSTRFDAEYAANQTPKYRADGGEITPPSQAAPEAPPSGPGALAPRYRAMSTALGGIGSQQDLDRLNALLNPHRGTPPVLPRGRVRATGAAATAAQELAVATLGGRAQMAEHIQTLLGKSDAELGDLKPYVDALRAQLRGIPPGNVLTKIDDWLKDNMAGVTTDLAIMIARSVPTGEGESSPSILQGWAQAIGAPTTGRTTRYTAPQLLGSGENGVVTLSVQAVQIARAHAQQQPGTPAPPPGGPPGAGG
jgi:hypothetical protein